MHFSREGLHALAHRRRHSWTVLQGARNHADRDPKGSGDVFLGDAEIRILGAHQGRQRKS